MFKGIQNDCFLLIYEILLGRYFLLWLTENKLDQLRKKLTSPSLIPLRKPQIGHAVKKDHLSKVLLLSSFVPEKGPDGSEARVVQESFAAFPPDLPCTVRGLVLVMYQTPAHRQPSVEMGH